MSGYPCYLETYETGELQCRAEEAIASLGSCLVCPRRCLVNRLHEEVGVCKSGRYAQVSSCFPHLGEEDCLRGWRGSGTLFFAHCNLRCVFCQNYDISHAGEGSTVTAQQIAEGMLGLQRLGCHNINFVTPSHVVPQILEALPFAIAGGLRLPIVYNTSAYDSVETLRWLEGIIDIYMPDFKYWEPEPSRLYLTAQDYPERAREAIREMHRQVGDLVLDDRGLARRGLLVRHLVMPGGEAETQAILKFLAEEISPDTYVNLMPQYHPGGKVRPDYRAEINRPIQAREYRTAVETAVAAGLTRLDRRQV